MYNIIISMFAVGMAFSETSKPANVQ